MVPLLLAAAGCGSGSPRSSEDRPEAGDAVPEVRAAVASSVARAHGALAEVFTAETGVRVRASLGSTGGLYAQIRNGAPYDVFLAADGQRPARLVAEGLAEPGSRFTYAEGRLVLFAPGLSPGRPLSETLQDRRVRHVAVADPEAAPYGAAAREVLRRTGMADRLSGRLVQAENVGQAYQYVMSGAAEAGFVAASLVDDQPAGTYVVVDDSLHPPIRQDAVLVTRAGSSAAARRFLDFLRSERAREVLHRFGYRVPARSGDESGGSASSTGSVPEDRPSGGGASKGGSGRT